MLRDDSMTKNGLYFCNTVHTLRAMQCVIKMEKKYCRSNNSLVLVSRENYLSKYVEENIWENVYYLDTSRGRLYVLFMAARWAINARSVSYDEIAFGHLEFYFERIVSSLVNKKITLFDEGVSSILYAQRGMGYYFNEKKLTSGYASRILWSLINKILLRFSLGGIDYEHSLLLRLKKFYTLFELDINGVETIKIDMKLICTSYCESALNVIFVGQPRYDGSTLLSRDEYYNSVVWIKRHYEELGYNFFYCPHPREHDVHHYFNDVVFLSSPIEDYLTSSECTLSFKVVASVNSTAAFLLKAQGAPYHFHLWRSSLPIWFDEDDLYAYWMHHGGELFNLPDGFLI